MNLGSSWKGFLQLRFELHCKFLYVLLVFSWICKFLAMLLGCLWAASGRLGQSTQKSSKSAPGHPRHQKCIWWPNFSLKMSLFGGPPIWWKSALLAQATKIAKTGEISQFGPKLIVFLETSTNFWDLALQFHHTVEHFGESTLVKHGVFEHLEVKTWCKTAMFN